MIDSVKRAAAQGPPLSVPEYVLVRLEKKPGSGVQEILQDPLQRVFPRV